MSAGETGLVVSDSAPTPFNTWRTVLTAGGRLPVRPVHGSTRDGWIIGEMLTLLFSPSRFMTSPSVKTDDDV